MSRVSRRFLLKSMSAGATLLALPFLRTLRAAAGPTPAPPKRLFVLGTPNGTIMDQFWPSDGVTYPSILKSLEPYRAKLNILRGVDWKTAGKAPVPIDHLPDFFNMLIASQPVGTYGTIKPTAISIDQHVAKAIGTATKFQSLQLGVIMYSSPMTSSGDGGAMPPENNPFNAFDRAFSDLKPGDPAAAARLRAERKSVLDLVQAELADVRCELGAEERPKFDHHLDSIREVERGLEAKTAAESCTAPALGSSFDPNDETILPQIMKSQFDIAVAALACDLTRLVTLQTAAGNAQHPWVGVNHGHHDIAHGNFPLTDQELHDWGAMIDAWYASQFAYIVGKLDAIPEGSGTMLDNTLCVWSHEQSNASSHQRTDHPYVLAGGCGGTLKTGRVIDCKGAAHNGLLITIANAMGVPTTSFGDPDFSSGPLSALA
jgi:hypothetical protein